MSPSPKMLIWAVASVLACKPASKSGEEQKPASASPKASAELQQPAATLAPATPPPATPPPAATGKCASASDALGRLPAPALVRDEGGAWPPAADGDPCGFSQVGDLNGDGLRELQVSCRLGSTYFKFLLYLQLPDGCLREIGMLEGMDWTATRAKENGFLVLTSRVVEAGDEQGKSAQENRYSYAPDTQSYAVVDAPQEELGDPSPLIIGERSVDGIKLGATKQEAIAASRLRAVDKVVTGEDGVESVVVQLQDGAETAILLELEGNAVSAITVHSIHYETPEGVRVGMSSREIVGIYGKPTWKGGSCEDSEGTDVGFARAPYLFSFAGCGGWAAVHERDGRLASIRIPYRPASR